MRVNYHRFPSIFARHEGSIRKVFFSILFIHGQRKLLLLVTFDSKVFKAQIIADSSEFLMVPAVERTLSKTKWNLLRNKNLGWEREKWLKFYCNDICFTCYLSRKLQESITAGKFFSHYHSITGPHQWVCLSPGGHPPISCTSVVSGVTKPQVHGRPVLVWTHWHWYAVEHRWESTLSC